MSKTKSELQSEINKLKTRIKELESTAGFSGKENAGPELHQKPGSAKPGSIDFLYQDLMEQMNEGAVILTQTGIVLYCNHRLSQILEQPLEEFTGNSIYNFFRRGDRAYLVKLLAEGARANISGNLEFMSKRRKQKKQLLISFAPIKINILKSPAKSEATNAVSMIVTDVTEYQMVQDQLLQYKNKLEMDVEKRTAELQNTVRELEESQKALFNLMEDALQLSEKLKLSEQRLVDAQQIAEMGDFEYDMDSGDGSWSSALYDLLGYGSAQVTDEKFIIKKIFLPEDRDKIINWINTSISSGKAELPSFEFRVRKKNGEVIFVRVIGEIKYRADKKPLIFATIQDITRRKMDEIRLSESEERFRTAFMTSPDSINMNRLEDGVYIDINEGFTRISGYTREEVIGKSSLELNIWDDPADRERMVKILQSDGIVHNLEAAFLMKNGSVRNGLMSAAVIRVNDEDVILSITRDITEMVKAREQLKNREQRMAEMSRMAKVGAWEFDALTLKGGWSEETARIHDIDPTKNVTINDAINFYVGDSKVRITKAIKNAIKNGKSYDLELEIKSAKGIHKWVRTQGIPIKENKKVVKVRGTFQDITDRKIAEIGLEKYTNRLELLLKAGQEMTSTLDLDKIFKKAIEFAIQMQQLKTGSIYLLKENNLILQSAIPALHKNFPNHLRIAALKDHPHIRKAIVTRLPVILKDTKKEKMTDAEKQISEIKGLRSIIYVPILWSEEVLGVIILGSIGQTIEFTESEIDLYKTLAVQIALTLENSKLYQKIKIQADELEKRVELRTKELEKSNKELEAFAYSVSHDLRAPLRAINGFTRILTEEYVDNMNAEARRLAAVIQENTYKMGQLIDDLLSFSRLGRTNMSYTTINMKKMALALYNETATQREKNKIQLTIDDIPLVFGDSNMMKLVWSNLISNAIKFSSFKRQPVIKIGAQKKDNSIIYWIEDNGAGFNMKYKDKLFGVFQRLHSEQKFKGTGVGLALVQRIVERHGGTVWGEGKINRGARLSFSLPAQKVELNKFT